MMFKRVLFVTNGLGDDHDALLNAMTLSSKAEDGLDILIIIPKLPPTLDDYVQKLTDNSKDAYKQMLEKIQLEKSLNTKVSVSSIDSKDAANLTIKKVLQEDYDLLVKKAELNQTEKGFMSFDMDLLRKCPCPVLLCRDKHNVQEGKIAVAVNPVPEDESEASLSKKLLRLASEIRTSDEQTIDLIACWDFTLESTLASGTWISMSSTELGEERAKVERQSLNSLNALCEALASPKTYVMHHLEGLPFVQVPEFTEKSGIDLLVMGTVARTGVASFFIGNTAENILQSLSCSLLAIKPTGFVSPVKIS